MKHFLFLFFILLGTCGAWAQNVYFSYSDGTKGAYSLNDVRRMTFNNNTMNLELNDGTTYQWSISDIASFRYNELTGIGGVLQGLNGLDVKLYPNPNNGNFQLTYKLPKPSNVEVGLYAADGKLVKVLHKGQQGAGEQQINTGMNELPKGIYTCRIEAEGFIVNKKMVVN